ncbi:Polysaccharide deacetylase [Nocardioides alpinus]|uniref:Polysaccharide deacetylase n=1 Tax=Nocardioides alpinus TaxID=748909 RepID=A0A1I0VSU7_9ACTN|nr:polysaccharide deacetylase family protein [Nocardioides alpinus]PKH37438.1 polysaccharide deacetylase family protein [Nocardioides alpinus]SFA79077.1 Polysaccharide deacetylase [Nocardioides alpinus]
MSWGGESVNVCFHGVGTPARELEPGEAPYWIDVPTFLGVLDLVVNDPRVQLSFDDGNASDVLIGLPALLERGLDATFFVLAGRLDQPGSLSTQDVRDLAAAGMRIGTHGMDHVPWRRLEPHQRQRELVDARRRIEDIVGARVDEAALPLGRYDRTLLAHLRRLGYAAVHSSDRCRARSDAWLRPRYSIRSDDTVAAVRETVLAAPSVGSRAERLVTTTVKRLR